MQCQYGYNSPIEDGMQRIDVELMMVMMMMMLMIADVTLVGVLTSRPCVTES